MNMNDSQLSNALDHVDPERRGFLAKMLAGGVALPVMSSIALGQTGEGKGKGGKGKGEGKAGGAGKGKGQPGGPGGANRDPAEMAKRLISEFDKDGDNALNVRELAAALTAMRDRRGPSGGVPGDGAGKGKGGAGKGGAGKGKGGAGKGQPAAGEGVKPKRPE